MSGRVTAGGGREAVVARELRRPDRIRTEFTYQGVTGVYAFDGERGWKVSPFDGSFAPELMESEEERQTADQADIEGPLADYEAKGHRVALLGKESLDGLDVYKLEVTLRNGCTLRQYLDANTYLPVRAESTVRCGASGHGRAPLRGLPRRRGRPLPPSRSKRERSDVRSV
jgi:hypothetical protein